jgi:RNA polymerase sigma factor (sigma-70 family)
MKHKTMAPPTLTQLYKSLYPSLIRAALKLAPSADQAEDLVQEAMVRILGNKELTFANQAAAYAFIQTTMKRLAIDFFRKCKVSKTDAIGSDIDTAYENSDFQQKQIDHRLTLVATLEITNALNAIANVPGTEVLSMFYLEGLSAKEIGIKTGETVGTVTSKISRQRQRHAPMIKSCIEAAWAMYA